jgi:DNA-binding Lrp family transcriptional regulator
MDRLDVMIYRELFHGSTGPPLESDIRKSFRSTAKKLHIDEVTIRNRVGKLRKSGFLKGLRLVVHPSLLGVRFGQLWFQVRHSSGKDDAIRKLSLMSGVLVIADYYGSGLTVVFIYESEAFAKKEIELIAKISNAESLVSVHIPFPECVIDLAPSDWRIIKAIQTNPRQSYSAISAQAGISMKTAKRRLHRMIQGRALFVVPSINPKALHGAIIADLVVQYADPKAKADVDRRIVSQLEKLLLRAELLGTEHSFFNFVISNIAEANETLSWAKQQPGVQSAFLELVQDRIEFYEAMNEHVEKRLAERSASIKAPR